MCCLAHVTSLPGSLLARVTVVTHANDELILKNILLQANLQLTALFMLHQSCLCRYPPSPVLCCCCRYHFCIALWGIYADVISSACLPRNRFTYYWFNTKVSDIPKNSCILFYRTKQHVNVEFWTQTECYFLHWDTTDSYFFSLF